MIDVPVRASPREARSGVFKWTGSDLRCWWMCLPSACLVYLLKIAQKCSGGHYIIGHISKEESACHLLLSLMPRMSFPLA